MWQRAQTLHLYAPYLCSCFHSDCTGRNGLRTCPASSPGIAHARWELECWRRTPWGRLGGTCWRSPGGWRGCPVHQVDSASTCPDSASSECVCGGWTLQWPEDNPPALLCGWGKLCPVTTNEMTNQATKSRFRRQKERERQKERLKKSLLPSRFLQIWSFPIIYANQHWGFTTLL